MILNTNRAKAGFKLVEMMVALAVFSVIIAAITAASISLKKSLNATDDFFSTNMQQVRIIDYLNRDVKRSYIVTASADKKTVTCILPNYLTNNVRTTPAVTQTGNNTFVSYPSSRTVMDGVTTSGSTTLTSATANFASSDVGSSVAGTNFASGTTISSVTNSTTAVLSAGASTTGSNATLVIGGTTVVYSISGNSILRTENGVVTNIASSTDQLLPQSQDFSVDLTNTEYMSTQVTFQPIFTSGGASAEQSGTTVYTTSYLRNKRRG